MAEENQNQNDIVNNGQTDEKQVPAKNA